MKKISLKIMTVACCAGILAIQACQKTKSEIKEPAPGKEYSAYLQGIDLRVDFNFQRNNPDNFNVVLSDNFSLEQTNSLYNSEQHLEYFTLRCKKSDGSVYLVSGTVDVANKVNLEFQKTKAITY